MSDSKVWITITNRAPGLQPPVYVAGSFSEPEWVPEPMEYTSGEDGVYTFTKRLEVAPESKIVYKFKVGEGDWWLLNEDAPTVTDDAGNRNNVLDAPNASVPEKHASTDEPAVEPEQLKAPAEDIPQSQTTTEIEHPKPVSHVQAFKESEEADQSRVATPEFIKTVTEVAESAALLDRSTPDPEARDTTTDPSEQHFPTALLLGAADTAAEVADSAALLDRATPEPDTLDGGEDASGEAKETPSEVAAQVADTAETLDNDESIEAPSEVAAQVEDTAETLVNDESIEAPSEVAAQVADTAETLDNDESIEAPSEVAAQVADTAETLDNDESIKTPSEVAAQVADTAEHLDNDKSEEAPSVVAAQGADNAERIDTLDEDESHPGSSNDSDPVPLFAHECAGLYEDDEIPGADEQELSSYNGHFFKDDKEDFNDPTLEKFPSTRDGIMSTVRKVGSGLNVDQVSDDRVPLSPIGGARGSSTASEPARGSADFLASPTSQSPTSRDLQHLSISQSLTSGDERSASVISLHSIVEDEENGEEDEEPVESQNTNHGEVVHQYNGTPEVPDVTKTSGTEATEEYQANVIAPVVEHAETAEDVIEASQEAEGEQSEEMGSTGKDLPSVDDIPVENITSLVDAPAEHPPAIEDIASVVEQTNGHDDAQSADKSETRATQDVTTRDINSADAKTKDGDDTVEAASKPNLDSLVTVPSSSVKPTTSLLSPISDDDEAVVVKSVKGEGEGEDNTKSGYLTPDRAATPQPEEPGSPREPAPNAADPVDEYDLESDAPKPDAATVSVPRSPSIVVSKPDENLPNEELLPAASLPGGSSQETETMETSQVSKDKEPSSEVENAEDPAKDSQDVEAARLSKNAETFASSETPTAVNGTEGTASQSANTAATSAAEANPTDGLKKRSVARPDPMARTPTPKSFADSHKEAAKGGNWFSSFLRLIFIDFFGGLLRKLSGGGRKT